MKTLKERILAEGQNLGSGILKIDSILNHQIYPDLMMEMGREMVRLVLKLSVGEPAGDPVILPTELVVRESA